MKTSWSRRQLEPRLVDLIAGLRRHQVQEAMQLLLDYIDATPQRDKTEKLTAAAPELLDALRKLVAVVRDRESESLSELRAADAAIAKAEGGAP